MSTVERPIYSIFLCLFFSSLVHCQQNEGDFVNANGCGVANPPSRIVGGSVTVPNEFPWQTFLIAYLPSGGANYCGGSLISSQWVLTAAHCLQGANSVYLILGAHNTSDLSPYAEPNRVAYLNVQYFLHPLWNPNTLMSDLALVKLPENVAFNYYIRPICLPDSTDPDHVGDSVTLTGWGWYDSNNVRSTLLRKASATVISNVQCQASYGPTYVTSGTICTAYAGSGTCSGDSGGPMNFKQADGTWRHIGISSFVDGAGCQGGKPAGFTRTRSYLDWITCAITSGQPQGCFVPSTTTSAPSAMDCRSKPNGNYPDPVNSCSGSFYMCSDGYAYRFNCPENLVYNIRIDACDYRFNVPPCNNSG